jgi:hypothetical protein
MKRLLSFVPRQPCRGPGPAGGAAGIADHAAREGVWPAIEPINRYEDDLTNRLEQAVGLGEVIEPVLPWDPGLADVWVGYGWRGG